MINELAAGRWRNDVISLFTFNSALRSTHLRICRVSTQTTSESLLKISQSLESSRQPPPVLMFQIRLFPRIIPQLNLRVSRTHLRSLRHSHYRNMSSEIPKTMRGILIEKEGGPEVLQLKTDLPVPQPGAGEVLVKNELGGINYIDT
jgi:hypothetical protein